MSVAAAVRAARAALALTCLAMLVLQAGCGKFEVGVEDNRSPALSSVAAAATATALAGENEGLARQNAALATQVADLARPSPSFTPGTPGRLGMVAYVKGGDIWVKPLPVGEPWRVTFDGRNSEPKWSATGKWLAFRKERQLWLVHPDGASAHPFPTEDSSQDLQYAWSPSGDRLAFIYWGPGLYVADQDALNRAFPTGDDISKMLLFEPDGVEGEDISLQQIVWSAGGTQIATTVARSKSQSGSGDAVNTYLGIWVVPASRTSESLPAEKYAAPVPSHGGIILAGWGTDNFSLLGWRTPGLSGQWDNGLPQTLWNLGSGDAEQLPYTMLHPDYLAGGVPGKVAFTAGAGRETWQNKRIVLLTDSKDAPLELTGASVAAFSPDLSPDGAAIAYVSMPDQGASINSKDALMQRHIWVRDAAGRSPARQLTGDPQYRDERPLWSSDGTHLLFARLTAPGSLQGQGAASLWLLPTGTGVPVQVADELTPAPDAYTDYAYVDWSRWFDWWRGPTR